jgi:hypothetical protein
MFKKATRTQRKLRMSLYGASGSGKTYTALVIAKELGSIAVIDTEHASASLYAKDEGHSNGLAEFEACELEHYAPADYIRALKAAVTFDVVVIDSLSHAWMGEGGLLDQADKKGGRFDAWKDLTPQQNEMFEAMLSFPGHVIVTMRSKTEYMVSTSEKDGKTKTKIERVGLAPIQKKESEYEFDVVAHLDQDNVMHIVKSRFQGLGADIRKPDAKWAALLKQALLIGATPQPKPAPVSSAEAQLKQSEEQIKKAVAAFDAVATRDDLDAVCVKLKNSAPYIQQSKDVNAAMERATGRVSS